MGCWPSKAAKQDKEKTKDTGFRQPKWSSDEMWDEETLQRKREEFWDTQPAYGGAREVWDALKAVAEDQNNSNNQLILESAGIIVHHNDLRTTYDERVQVFCAGFKYDLPNFVLSEPTNLVRDAKPSEGSQAANPGEARQVELTSNATS